MPTAADAVERVCAGPTGEERARGAHGVAAPAGADAAARHAAGGRGGGQPDQALDCRGFGCSRADGSGHWRRDDDVEEGRDGTVGATACGGDGISRVDASWRGCPRRRAAQGAGSTGCGRGEHRTESGCRQGRPPVTRAADRWLAASTS